MTRVSLIAMSVAVALAAVPLVEHTNGHAHATPSAPLAPPGASAEHAHAALDRMVRRIESFRDDHAALPSSLAEIVTPADGVWTYTKLSDRYRVVLSWQGHIVTFDSDRLAADASR